MSRSGYVDDYDGDDNPGRQNLWWATVARSIRGRRGQAFLNEMAAALDAMPVKELVAEEIVRDEAHICALGAVAVARKMDVSKLDPEDPDTVADTFGISSAMAREIAYENDVIGDSETPAQRWTRMRKWVSDHIKKAG